MSQYADTPLDNFLVKRREGADHTNPPHYRQGAIECIAAIEASLTPEEFRGYLKGNIIKYTWRERHKQGDTDLRKGLWYLLKLLKEEAKPHATREPQAPMERPAQGTTPDPDPALPIEAPSGPGNNSTPNDGIGVKTFKVPSPSSAQIAAHAEAVRDREIPA